MIVLHGDAVLALLRDELEAAEVAALLRSSEDTHLSALAFAELVDHLVRERDGDEDDVLLDLAQLELLAPLPVDADDAVRAGLLRARHHRKEQPITLVDCVAIETARSTGGRFASTNPTLVEICLREGVAIERLDGGRPQRTKSVTSTGSA